MFGTLIVVGGLSTCKFVGLRGTDQSKKTNNNKWFSHTLSYMRFQQM